MNAVELSFVVSFSAVLLTTAQSAILSLTRRADGMWLPAMRIWFEHSALPALALACLLVPATTWLVNALDTGWTRWQPLAFPGLTTIGGSCVLVAWELVYAGKHRATTAVFRVCLGTLRKHGALDDDACRSLRLHGLATETATEPPIRKTADVLRSELETTVKSRIRVQRWLVEIGVAVILLVAGLLACYRMLTAAESVLGTAP